MTKVKQLDLLDNLIETLDDPNSFENNKQLCVISLSGNQLVRLNRRQLYPLNNLRLLDLPKNN